MLPQSCVCVIWVGLAATSRQADGPDTQADGVSGSFCRAKQTRAETAGVAEAIRARETGKPGCKRHRRSKGFSPHVRQAMGLFSQTTRAAEFVRPSGCYRLESAPMFTFRSCLFRWESHRTWVWPSSQRQSDSVLTCAWRRWVRLMSWRWSARNASIGI